VGVFIGKTTVPVERMKLAKTFCGARCILAMMFLGHRLEVNVRSAVICIMALYKFRIMIKAQSF